ncbi:MAG: hypothetical protein ACRD0C_17955 [Acidimicrobiia bacterium]
MRKRRGGEDRPPEAGTKKRSRFRLAKDRRVEAVGVAVIAFGCLVTALVWMGVRESNNVSYQLPIIASGGLVAVGCFIVGGLLVVGGLVMTRFARLEQARAAASPEDEAEPAAPAAPPEGSDQTVALSEAPSERRELAG